MELLNQLLRELGLEAKLAQLSVLWSTYAGQPRTSVMAIGFALFVFTLFFVVFFLLRSIPLRIRLWRVAYRLRNADPLTSDFKKIFAADRKLLHLWNEYRHTLHPQKEFDAETATDKVVALRATSSAEHFFNSQTVYETRLRTEFFKHLPGICTGLGIIGTFLGLIQGLSAFNVSENIQEVRSSIDALLHGVYEAFEVSVTAIILAIAITFVEKWIVSSLSHATELIVQRLDAIFESGANTEYLERLVRSSEETAKQSRILKDSLVADLKEVLSELTRKQIEAANAHASTIGPQIASSLKQELADPLAKISAAVAQVSNDQSGAVTKLLTDVLASFSEQLKGLLQSQATDITRLQQEAAQGLRAAVDKIDAMVVKLDETSSKSTTQLTSSVADAITNIQKQLAQFETSTGTSTNTLSNSADRLSSSIDNFLAAVGGLINAVSAIGQTSDNLMRSADQIATASSRLSEVSADYNTTRASIAAMIGELGAITEVARRDATVTSEIVARIEASANKLNEAQLHAQEFLDRVSDVLESTHREFAENMRKTLGEANRQFFDQLSQATGLLRTGIMELETTLTALDIRQSA
ncbi:MotA/TolQ/ExbB proton channel family protein [Bradyrhizobium sp. CB1717]|uniref:MotA/TolQ/ExbB proton channel family protein n=1 Tax=Bradyrhizobium sp. CB1717 TaxID=3039154 RepID=UPI0024B1393B|nr:MotA/TolQ/ExbB proton channel family protein [Bradyrhizobium sp. CB1717]WFU25119.1 MotA/TolQ/ExbB proton channel family protein [Bradyrhizobium sp. CB1717]